MSGRGVRVGAAVLVVALAGLSGWWLWGAEAPDPSDAVVAEAPASTRPVHGPAAGASAALASGPWRRAAAVPAATDAALALWQQREQRARQTLEAYRHSTRLPHHARPAAEQSDQMHPGRPVVDERPLRLPGRPPAAGVRLRTSQDRIFVSGDETADFTVTALDDNGHPVPLQVLRAYAQEGATGERRSALPELPLPFADDGREADAAAGDGTWSARLQPARQGYADFHGLIRVALQVQVGPDPGFLYFDVIYTPQWPATWAGPVREELAQGSLDFYLKLNVRQAGRYVVQGRVDDALGRPVALLSFNDELPAGPGEVRLQLFGLLVREARPRFPLVLRDVDGFLLLTDQFPDRALLPRRAGVVHRSQEHPLLAFSDAPWQSEERSRYLAEYGKDLAEAQARLKALAGDGP